MEQFSTLFRSKDKQPVSYLIVDDSVFARKNLSKIVEGFGGKVAGEAGDGMTAIAESFAGRRVPILRRAAMAAEDRGWLKAVRQTPGAADGGCGRGRWFARGCAHPYIRRD